MYVQLSVNWLKPQRTGSFYYNREKDVLSLYGTNTVIVLIHLCFNIMKSDIRAEMLLITCSKTNIFAGENIFSLLNVSAEGNHELLVSLVKYLRGCGGGVGAWREKKKKLDACCHSDNPADTFSYKHERVSVYMDTPGPQTVLLWTQPEWPLISSTLSDWNSGSLSELLVLWNTSLFLHFEVGLHGTTATPGASVKEREKESRRGHWDTVL